MPRKGQQRTGLKASHAATKNLPGHQKTPTNDTAGTNHPLAIQWPQNVPKITVDTRDTGAGSTRVGQGGDFSRVRAGGATFRVYPHLVYSVKIFFTS